MAIAVLALIALTPLLCGIAITLVAEDRGPILYRQERLGHGGRRFRILKFRTMVVDAERETGPVWAVPSDPRVTRVGRTLRATHLDELPQLVNVIRGEMRLVGPRPERPQICERLRERIPAYDRRSSVPPGITGLAQIRAGYDTSLGSVRRKLRYDLLYIRSQSVVLDLAILLGTVSRILRGHSGA